jgi:hypothetical protein
MKYEDHPRQMLGRVMSVGQLLATVAECTADQADSSDAHAVRYSSEADSPSEEMVGKPSKTVGAKTRFLEIGI